MGVYDQSKYMTIQEECFCFCFRFGTACNAIILQVPLHKYFLQLGRAIQASVQSIFLRNL